MVFCFNLWNISVYLKGRVFVVKSNLGLYQAIFGVGWGKS